MPYDNVQIAMSQSSLRGKIDQYFANVGLGVNPAGLRRARLHEIVVLEALSDAELARMGLSRDDILPFVFRDLLAA
ncbi:MAG: hypothetical protein QNJ09_05705 [Paracoccaceae bacterium]|nr:hypothetical protein [Paracoccaceae bacterium]